MTLCKKMEFRQQEISPSLFNFFLANDNASMKRGFSVVSGPYKLRPETIEAIFYAWRFTGNTMYQEWAWQIFLSLEKYCKTPSSYRFVSKAANYSNIALLQ